MKKILVNCGFALLALVSALPAFAGSAADEVLIANPYVRAVPAVMQNSGAFMTFENTGGADHAVVSAFSSAAKVVELHTHVNDGGVMRMRQIPRIDVAAGGSTELKPGGLHVMLIGLQRPLVPGDNVEIGLTFADGSSKTFEAPVKAVGGMHHGMHHGGNSGHSM